MFGKPTHKYFMLHYTANQHFVGDQIFRTDDEKELMLAIEAKYARTLQPAQIYAIFILDERTGLYHGFDFDAAVEYLNNRIKGREPVAEDAKQPDVDIDFEQMRLLKDSIIKDAQERAEKLYLETNKILRAGDAIFALSEIHKMITMHPYVEKELDEIMDDISIKCLNTPRKRV